MIKFYLSKIIVFEQIVSISLPCKRIEQKTIENKKIQAVFLEDFMRS